jgi:hypothetical protein
MNTHDELLLNDLNRQRPWVLGVYVVTGLLSLGVGFGFDFPQSRILCAGGGFLTALGIEKLVTQKIRKLALELWEKNRNLS